MRVLGIMSGTSLDGVDNVVCTFSKQGKVSFREYWHVPFGKVLRQRLLAAASNSASTYELAQLHHDLGRFYARAAQRTKVDLVGMHGQTVYHRPDRTNPATLQIGEPAYLAAALGVPVVSNFRAADLASGGQGAPLATMFHRHVFAEKGKHLAVNNLGGISNVTSLDWRSGREPRVLAFDTGPANILIDLAVARITGGKRRYDKSGKLAAQGTVDQALLSQWLRHPFFRQAPPKSTGRELFGAEFVEKAAKKIREMDLVATLTEFTARSVALNYGLHLRRMPTRVVLCGGGAENPVLVRRIARALQERSPSIEVIGSAQLGWHPQVIEGAAFALLAWLRWNERAGNIPQTTGAARTCRLGQITVP